MPLGCEFMATIKELTTMNNIEEKIRTTPLQARIDVCQVIVADLCEKGRHIRMSIPVNENDEDLMISITLQDCRNRIENLERIIRQMRLDTVQCHVERDILDTLSEAMDVLPTCGTLSILAGASQEIQALRASEIHLLSHEA
jgi:hypothetical protein